MLDTELYETLLGLTAPWEVASVSITKASTDRPLGEVAVCALASEGAAGLSVLRSAGPALRLAGAALAAPLTCQQTQNSTRPTPRRPLYDGAELNVHAHRVSPGITRAERALVGIFPAALRRVVRASAAAIGCATRLTCWRK